jgi:chromate transporter
VAGAVIVSVTAVSIGQIAAILFGGLAGFWLCRSMRPPPTGAIAIAVSSRAGFMSLAVFALLALLPLLVRALGLPQGVALFDAFYRSGALVFGGGHVVLPLLRSAFVTAGWVSDDTFLDGYGAAQAVPGPLFTFAAYLGAVVHLPPNGVAGAAIGLVGIFLPGMLILIATLPHWGRLRTRANAQASMRGINAAVVGILGAALYNPVWSSTVRTPADVAAALAGFLLLIIWRVPPVVVVIGGALAGIGLAQFASR